MINCRPALQAVASRKTPVILQSAPGARLVPGRFAMLTAGGQKSAIACRGVDPVEQLINPEWDFSPISSLIALP
jgi:hypothetical protein